jgi:hypothetical protein
MNKWRDVQQKTQMQDTINIENGTVCIAEDL